jgi:hypothetical protein
MPLNSNVFVSHGYGRTARPHPYALLLSTQRERDAASLAVDRLIDAGLTYPDARIALRALMRCGPRPHRPLAHS